MPYSHPQPIDRSVALKKIPHLIPGALTLAGTAGYVNSVALGFFHTPVSHMTGAISHLGVDLAVANWSDAGASLSIVLGFLGGAVLTGILVGARKLIPGRRYGVVMLCEGALLALATGVLRHQQWWGLPMVAFACGLQNAMTSSYCGLIIRTTHVTGTVTDIGVMIGHWIRHRQIERFKLVFLLAVFLAFGVGGWLGACANRWLGVSSLGVAAAGCAVAGTIFVLIARRGREWVEISAANEMPQTRVLPGS